MSWPKAFISKFPPTGRKRETKLETSRKRSAVFSVKLETARKRAMETKTPKNTLFVSSLRELRKNPLTHLREVSSRRFWSLCASGSRA